MRGAGGDDADQREEEHDEHSAATTGGAPGGSAFPAFAGSPGQYPGFEMSFRAVNYANGTHTIWIRITAFGRPIETLKPR